MSQFDEALASRESKYAGWTEDELRSDARCDILRLLNVFTDVLSPTAADIAVIESLSESVRHLEAHDENPAWKDAFPKVAEAWCAMKASFCAFVTAKASGRYAPDLIPQVFACHRALAKAVMEMTTTEEERQAIVSAMKK